MEQQRQIDGVTTEVKVESIDIANAAKYRAELIDDYAHSTSKLKKLEKLQKLAKAVTDNYDVSEDEVKKQSTALKTAAATMEQAFKQLKKKWLIYRRDGRFSKRQV